MRHYAAGKPLSFDVGQTPARMIVPGAVLALLALLAGLFGFYPREMYAAAAVAGAGVALLAAALFYRQTRVQRASVAALQSAEERVGGLVESAMDAIVSVDESQRIVLYNSAAEKVFLWPRTAVMGKPLDTLLAERFRAAHRRHVGEFGRTGATSRRMGDARVLYGLRASGEEFPMEASISQHSEDGRRLLTVILRDVTERVRAEEALRKYQEELRELSAAAHTIREQEQRRVAREIHDELGQSLTALKM